MSVSVSRSGSGSKVPIVFGVTSENAVLMAQQPSLTVSAYSGLSETLLEHRTRGVGGGSIEASCVHEQVSTLAKKTRHRHKDATSAAMASPRGHHRRSSMDEPIKISDVIHLKEELTRLRKKKIPKCNKRIKKISDLIDEFHNGYRLVIYFLKGAVITGRITMVLLALLFFVIGVEVSELSFAATAVVVVLSVAFGLNRKTQQEKILKRTIEKELKGFQHTINPIIDILEKICQRSEEIFRDPSLSEHKTQALSEHFAYCYEKSLFRQHNSSKVGDRLSKIVHLSGKLSEMIAKVSSVPDILIEIIEDDKRQHDKPAKPTREQINKSEFKEKAEKFINFMQKGICELKNGVKEINQAADRI